MKRIILISTLLVIITACKTTGVATSTVQQSATDKTSIIAVYDTTKVEYYHNTYAYHDTVYIKDSTIIYKTLLQSSHDTVITSTHDTILQIVKYEAQTTKNSKKTFNFAIILTAIITIALITISKTKSHNTNSAN